MASSTYLTGALFLSVLMVIVMETQGQSTDLVHASRCAADAVLGCEQCYTGRALRNCNLMTTAKVARLFSRAHGDRDTGRAADKIVRTACGRLMPVGVKMQDDFYCHFFAEKYVNEMGIEGTSTPMAAANAAASVCKRSFAIQGFACATVSVTVQVNTCQLFIDVTACVGGVNIGVYTTAVNTLQGLVNYDSTFTDDSLEFSQTGTSVLTLTFAGAFVVPTPAP